MEFDHPYRAGGSSRHLTISSLAVSPEAKDYPKRVIRKLYNKFKWDTKVEKKWSDMNQIERNFFAQKALELVQKKTKASAIIP